MRSVLEDVSASALVAGVISALVNYSGPFLIVLEATRAAGLNEAQTASWVWAVSIGNGVCSIALSLFTRMPIIVAWSTPGAALLIASLGGFNFSDAVGAFLVASIAAAVVGYTGWFGWLLDRVPAPVLQALLAGILLPLRHLGRFRVPSGPDTGRERDRHLLRRQAVLRPIRRTGGADRGNSGRSRHRLLQDDERRADNHRPGLHDAGLQPPPR